MEEHGPSGLPGTFGAEVPVNLREQRRIGTLAVSGDPVVHRVRCLDRRVSVLIEIRDAVRNPVDVRLRRARPCWQAPPGHRPETMNRLGSRPRPGPDRFSDPGPVVTNLSPPRPAMSIFASVPVIASKPVASTMTSTSKCVSDVLILVDRLDRRLADTDQLDVGPVERREIVGVSADRLVPIGWSSGMSNSATSGSSMRRGPSPRRTCGPPRWRPGRSSGRRRS